MNRAYVLHSTRIKYLRADGEGEFQNTVLRLAKEHLGIADDYAPDNCHQSNGLLERIPLLLAQSVPS
jgi:hypothetical protein